MPRLIPLSAVRPGDLLFNVFAIRDDRSDELQPAGVSGHVTICTFARDALVLMTHQVDGKNLKGTWEDQLKPPSATATNQVLVMRCRDEDLAAEAAIWARSWGKFLLPFGSTRRDRATLFEGGVASGETLVERHRELFAAGGRYRAIKYAARRLGFLCYPGEDSDGQGLFCSMFVAIAYQVAGLVLANAVSAASREDFELRISDKRMSAKDVDTVMRQQPGASPVDVEGFKGYAAGLREHNPYGLRGVEPASGSAPPKPRRRGITYLPSIAFWRYDRHPSIDTFPWAARITEGMMVDAKVIMPQGLLASLRADPAGWETVGFASGEPLDIGSFRERHEEKAAFAADLRQEFRAGSKR